MKILLNIIFSDGETGIFIIEDLLNEINQYDINPK